MAAQITGVLESSLQQKIGDSKILVVGAGGIGCEVLKNLVMSGFSDIEIIDLDTIDVSNLNRQFLFHKEHVGKSKAEVARESALAFNPDVKIKAYHDDIITTNYGVSFFQKFNLVLNALDNRKARNHVNRMCLTANVPLIESGTAGYDGQVELIKKGSTQCYECTPKPAQKSFPGCTIRNTPSEPIHCIVWAKHLYNQLFGEHNEDEDVAPDREDPEAAGENAGATALEKESKSDGNVERVSTRQWAQDTNYDAEKIFNKLFYDDIKYLLSMSDLWKERTPPVPMRYGAFGDDEKSSDESNLTGSNRDQKVWSIRECQSVFATSLSDLQKEFTKLAVDDHLVWDKDDKPAMDFVAACANVRAKIFNIPQKSRFEIKSMAGNIIPAIATTNAITAGLVVMRAFNVLLEQYEQCQSVYVRLRLNPRNQIFVPDRQLMAPNPKCIVCSDKPQVVVKIDTNRITVKQFRDEVLVKGLNMIEPDVITEGKGLVLISSEEGETDCNNDKKLCELEVVEGCILKVDDFVQQYELTVIISHKDVEREGELFEIVADPDSLIPENQTEEKEEVPEDNGEPKAKKRRQEPQEDSDDDLCIIEDGENNKNPPPTTSSAGSSSFGGQSSREISQPATSTVIDDDDDDVCFVEDEKMEEDVAGPSTSSKNLKRPRIEQEDDDLILIDSD
ncbi:SUMO-activating enzyme subunit 2 [Contarinia nasturtii]|uniref:SUMO-activating enzyme subunit 2 n=1 Tax=Contarinia nasturtii TaxID=265458 RepID=UPI0012D38758|nr:SUMO-activating enzyme subunit 2 [Contarinia nasturtii]XP_031628836.1 SUMO-activating enzyme subunit 2 [Contarinia nasturtii]XP_031628837.1 SUMO-activating enzyme subunit 2 [Contarinia nasturtii]